MTWLRWKDRDANNYATIIGQFTAQRKHLLKKDNKMRVSNMKGKIPSLSNFRRFQARPNIIKRNVKKIQRALP